MSGGNCKTECEPPPFEDADVAVVLRGNLADLQRAGDRLGQHGIEAAVMSTETKDAAGGCCSPTLYLVVARADADTALQIFDSDWRRGLTDDQIAALEAAAAIEHDPDAADTTCPACLTTFPTGPAACPDCGLFIA